MRLGNGNGIWGHHLLLAVRERFGQLDDGIDSVLRDLTQVDDSIRREGLGLGYD